MTSTLKKNKLKSNTKRVFSKKHYLSGDGMLTTIWGPNMWHYLHTLSFNYPVNPTLENKKYYKQFILNLLHTLPCKYCRINLKNNLKDLKMSGSCSFENGANGSRSRSSICF